MSSDVRAAVLAAIPLLAAAALGAWSLDFGLPFLFRPDEDVMVGRAVRMAAEGTLDPLFANYPPLVFDLLAIAERMAAVVGFPTLQGAVHADPSAAYLVGRGMSVLAAVVAVAFTFATARALHGDAAGFLAASVLAVAPLAVRQAHFATTDGVQTALVAASMWAGLRGRTPAGFAVAGVLAGLAAAAKYTGGLVLLVGLAAAWSLPDRRRLVTSAIVGAAVAFALPCLVVVLHPGDYLYGLAFLGGNAVVRGRDLPIGWIFHTAVTLPFGLGLGAYALSLAGLAVAAVRRTPGDVPLVVFCAGYYLVIGAGHENFFRYVLPLLPALAVLAGRVLHALPGPRAALVGAALVLLIPSVYASVRTDQLLGATDTRVVAARWLEANIPAGSALRASYYGSPFYDQGTVRANLRYVNDPLAAGFRQGRYTDRFRIADAGPGAELVESGPPAQGPAPRVAGAFSVTPFTGGWGGGVYDPLDSFYLPIWGFEGLRRPGPSIVVVLR
jgi:4-amino-4-deoxy-L-arabinose transferase-like glycosyltransferase